MKKTVCHCLASALTLKRHVDARSVCLCSEPRVLGDCSGPRWKVHGPNMSKPKKVSRSSLPEIGIYTCLGGGNSNKFWNFHPECLGFHDPI